VSGEPSPIFLAYAVTFRCTNRCAYCDLPDAPREMPFAESGPLLATFRAMGLVRVGFTGGEPLLHPDIGRIVRHCRELGILTVLSTNGILVPERIDEVADLDMASVSVDGYLEVDDALRGRGSFAAAVRAVDLFRDRGVAVVLSAVLSARNIGRLDDVSALARDLRVPVVWQPYFRAGRPPEPGDPDRPDPSAFREAVARLVRQKIRHPWRIASSLPYLRFIRDHYPTYDTVPCRAGRLYFGLSPDGALHACYPEIGRRPGVAVTPENARDVVRDFRRGPCAAPCYCNGHLENNLLLSLNPLSVADVLLHATALLGAGRRRRAVRSGHDLAPLPIPSDRAAGGDPRPCVLCGDREFRADRVIDRGRLVRCAGCGLVRTEGEPRTHDCLPTLAPGSPPRKPGLVDRIAMLGDRADLRWIERRRPAGSLLDVGCGDGRLLVLAAGRGWSVAGCEADTRAAAYCRDELGLDVFAGNLADRPDDGRRFDVAVCRYSLEHFPDPGAELDRIRDLLAPSGILLARVPNLAGIQAAAFRGRWLQLRLPGHIHHFTPRTLVGLAERHGYRTLRVGTPFSPLDPLGFAASVTACGDPARWRERPGLGGAARRALFAAVAAAGVPIGLLACLAGRGETVRLVAEKTRGGG
jgi:MoaA/NifB/PqqE/SkfB family radical SAM enzyme/SAM-dependent methyltransferase